jgi:hypothetical protein
MPNRIEKGHGQEQVGNADSRRSQAQRMLATLALRAVIHQGKENGIQQASTNQRVPSYSQSGGLPPAIKP